MRCFGDNAKAEQTKEVILGYDPTIPNWAYNGNARRYWDFGTAGKYERIERMVHHYGSALNAVPLLDAYRRDPSNLYLLRVGYGGLMGPISNIAQDGFSSVAFHGWPDYMDWDPYSGDFGIGYFDYAYATGTYVVDDPTYGWLGFGGNLNVSGNTVNITPKDGARQRLFIAPAGQYITLEAGRISSATYDSSSGNITLTLDPADQYTPNARVFVHGTTPNAGVRKVVGATGERGGYTVPLSSGPTTITIAAS